MVSLNSDGYVTTACGAHCAARQVSPLFLMIIWVAQSEDALPLVARATHQLARVVQSCVQTTQRDRRRHAKQRAVGMGTNVLRQSRFCHVGIQRFTCTDFPLPGPLHLMRLEWGT